MQTMTKVIGNKMLGSNESETYLNLFQRYTPRPIRSEAQLEQVQEVIDALIDNGELTSDEKDYLDVLGTLVYEYEQTLDPLPDIYGVELLKVLIEERELKQKDLVPVFRTESIISDVLHGRRQLTTRHIQELAEFFNVSPAVFFPQAL
jgi:HTH-type transcriptional regulator / antitoxin HigA